MVYIVGLGPGSKDYILPKAIDTLKKSNVIIGFKRLINDLDFINTNKIVISSLRETLEYIQQNGQDNIISLVASGDPTFFGISEYIKKNYPGNIVVIPGISSFQYLTTKLNKSWNYAFTGSVHARNEDFIEKVKVNKLSIWLTDNKNNSAFLCKLLNENNIECTVIIGEHLSYENERILQGKPIEFINEEVSDMAILIVEKEG
ncbi:MULTISPECIES: precorrin-6y C5,15-methyltransferase (decarboxylating) subunit CbiE [Clostridia]|jgi:cobalt-precorrin-7 (C5)-methyltransferase|uniref:Precorrin-6y C5,15-methyltransferase (Decarboxylating) subunit CbiE n=1 Tax=Clostridium saudiense TaxID=1414720 RepID=A0ABS2FLA1_9CLOT|nr:MULTISPECIES: precorrin-6y C5,15-methyltransferase (decarboxylating) subunit CbiE [Clostridiaceae]MBM6820668.1 precorrin-6y C5,15-methyltransferase (decarboxylating) subunit CbiE [Clostridium saudiense]MBP3917040.1 precorrin-6y C5,15-methyltransferase (decarboxylating) subunit CbiE [Clostridium sp.]